MWWEHLGITEAEWRAKIDRMNEAREEAFHKGFGSGLLWLFVILFVIQAGGKL